MPRRHQRAGTAGRDGFGGRSGSRSGRISGGGAGVGVSTGSTVIVRDGPSSEPVRRERERRGVEGGNFMAAPSDRSTGAAMVPVCAGYEASSPGRRLSRAKRRVALVFLSILLHSLDAGLTSRRDDRCSHQGAPKEGPEMSTSLLSPPPQSPPDDRDPGPPGGPPPRRSTGGPGRRPIALLVLLTAILGGGAGAGLVLLTGAGDRTTDTTVTQTISATGERASTAGGLDARALYTSTAAGVVDITSRGIASSSGGGSPFGGPGQSESTATGTGFVVDAKGHIVTAAHVVDGASSISVKFQDGTTRTARLLGTDNATDVAVLSVDASGLTLHPLSLGSSAALDIGDEVAAIGDPFTYERSLSTGIVSGLDRTISAPNGFTVAHAIQTDAALNPGNSGGPVLDAAGQVIGIVDQIATNGSSQTSSGVGFAVPIDLVRSELAQLEAGKPVRHAYLGVSTSTADSSAAGALVQSVTSRGPAADAGLRSGDVVTALGTTAIRGTNDLVAAIATHKPGERVELTVRRGSQTVKLTVTLGTQPTQATSSD
jgi:putative serine protease PepD